MVRARRQRDTIVECIQGAATRLVSALQMPRSTRPATPAPAALGARCRSCCHSFAMLTACCCPCIDVARGGHVGHAPGTPGSQRGFLRLRSVPHCSLPRETPASSDGSIVCGLWWSVHAWEPGSADVFGSWRLPRTSACMHVPHAARAGGLIDSHAHLYVMGHPGVPAEPSKADARHDACSWMKMPEQAPHIHQGPPCSSSGCCGVQEHN